MELLTRAEIIGDTEAGGDEARRRRRRFIHYQERGLIGHAIGKQPRQGGAGLWHPAQARLWDLYERQRGQARPENLANAPVGSWLLGIPGIELEQAQRAFAYWCRVVALVDREPAGERTGYRRRLVAAADMIADPHATRTARRRLRRVISMVADAQGMIVKRRTVEASVLAAITATGEAHPNARRYASNYYVGLDARYLALSHLDALASERARELWTWARDTARAGYADYQRDQATLRTLPVVGRFFAQDPDINNFVNSACATLTLLFGLGIRLLRHDPGVSLPPGETVPPTSLEALFAPR